MCTFTTSRMYCLFWPASRREENHLNGCATGKRVAQRRHMNGILRAPSSTAGRIRVGALLLALGGLAIVACSAAAPNDDASQSEDFSRNDEYSKLPYVTNLNLK